ncbi:MAG: DegT/DnrJ/EryC1/StrS family aminotransferase [Oscillospiraceae bacterium]|nr:DegT/DnrJ/EryC1/StrS family aminotransferase [Oscillospiraceae bacterium]
MERIYLSPPHLNGREIEYLREAVDTNWVAPAGPHLAAFEEELCQEIGGGFGAALSSGTAALHLALRQLGVGPGDVVLCSDLTFSGSVNPVLYEKAIPVFVDSLPGGCNVDSRALRRALEKNAKRVKAAIIVDLYGQSAAWDEILPLCEEYGVPVIEDAAEALGARYHGKSCGLFGEIGVFSFNGNKIITTSGGGMAIAKTRERAHKITFWANQAKEAAPYYLHRELGFNYRMSNLCAGVGRAQLLTLREHIARRREIHERYAAAFAAAKLPFKPVPAPRGCEPNYWLTTALLEPGCGVAPQDLARRLEAVNIEARRAWNPMHCQPVYAQYEYIMAEEGEPCRGCSEDFFRRGLCLPSGSGMTETEQAFVIEQIMRFFDER